MSDTIDAAAQPAIQLQRVHALESSKSCVPPVSARDFLRLAQGFYFVFWGLLLAVLAGSQLLILIGADTATESRAIEILILATEFFCTLFLGAGVIAILVGSWRLYQVRNLGERWHRRARVVLALAALLNYFCICFWFWRRVPESSYLLINALAFWATGILFMIVLTRAMAALSIALGRPDMALESRVLGTSNVVFLLLPFACVSAYLIVMMFVRHSSLFGELQSLLDRVNLLFVLILLLPFSLTLSLIWGCKDAVLRQLATFERKASPDADPI
ncbi:MAG TPA: hypothetical protein VL171_17480 [Verrucomicrobiae bacterium]|nr:hypothetical protein [Verrucomicrobiae bacterium]